MTNKIIIKTVCFAIIFTILNPVNAFAVMGDMGFFSGISEGTRLPKSTEILLSETGKNTKDDRKPTALKGLRYKEVVLLSGKPYVVDGVIVVKKGAPKSDEKIGTYQTVFTVSPTKTDAEASITRNITFNVNFRKEDNQIIEDYEVVKWEETIKTPEGTFTLDPKQSHFNVSILIDDNAAVDYYRGDISESAVYIGQGSGGAGATAAPTSTTTLESTGSFYGYNSVWSSSETHRIDSTISNDKWQMQYQIRPSVSVNKTLDYKKNELQAISFDGNYKEVMQNTSGLEYDIFVKPNVLKDIKDSGKVNIPVYNTFEQLIAPKLNYLKGHFAESDIKKLFSMQILTGDTKFYKPEQAMTRGQFTTALVKAIKLPITLVDTTKKATDKTPIEIVFPDVTPDRPEYPYVMAAYKNGLAIGKEQGNFYTDKPIDRQEAFAILVRTLGLSNLGLDPTPMTPFSDDAKIASWAKQEIYAAYKLGLISGDKDGKINPQVLMSKAEGAAVLNKLIDYMRYDLATDYTEHIVNYAD